MDLVELFSHMGIPEEIITDQNNNLCLVWWTDSVKKSGITEERTFPDHSQTDGLGEIDY